MPRGPPPGFYLLASIAFFIWYVIWTRDHERPIGHLAHAGEFKWQKAPTDDVGIQTAVPLPTGNAIMGKLGNETLKAELGRAAWKLFHTTMARFPDQPTADESKALKDYINLFARLYPCGECATHFQQILHKYPPQTSSRSTAAAWACFVHNEVNKSKDKPIFDCSNIGDWYDCGCADDEKDAVSSAGVKVETITRSRERFEIETEGPTRGG